MTRQRRKPGDEPVPGGPATREAAAQVTEDWLVARLRLRRPDIRETQARKLARAAIAHAAEQPLRDWLRQLASDGSPEIPHDLVQIGTAPDGSRLWAVARGEMKAAADPLDYVDLKVLAEHRGRSKGSLLRFPDEDSLFEAYLRVLDQEGKSSDLRREDFEWYASAAPNTVRDAMQRFGLDSWEQVQYRAREFAAKRRATD